MCWIWHETVTVDEWRTFIFKWCVFYLLNTSESTKHKFWDCIHVGVWVCNHGSFHWKQGLFRDELWKSFVKWVFDLASPLRHGALWNIWIESNDKVCNQSFWHESKGKHVHWDEVIMYAKAAWAKVIKRWTLCRWRLYSTTCIKLGVPGRFFATVTIWKLDGICKLHGHKFRLWLRWSLGGLGVVLGGWLGWLLWVWFLVH